MMICSLLNDIILKFYSVGLYMSATLPLTLVSTALFHDISPNMTQGKPS